MADIEKNKTSDDFEHREFLSLKHASLFLDIPVGTLRKRCAKGQIKFIRDSFSGRIYFSQKELIRYMKMGEQRTLAEIFNMAISQPRLSGVPVRSAHRSGSF